MLKQAAVLLAAVCWCLASVSGQRVPRPHRHKLDGFVAISHNGTEVRAVRGVTIAIKVAGGEGQASTRTSNGRIIVEMNYINGSQLNSCKFIHGRFKLRHFYRKFLNYAPFSPTVHRAMASRYSDSPEVVLVAVIAQGVLELKGFQRWTGAMIKEYGAMTNYSRVVHECRMWRKEHLSVVNVSTDNMPQLSHEDGASSDEDDVEDDDNDDEEGDDEITLPLSEIDAISNSSSYGARAFGRRNVTVLPLDRKSIWSSDKRNSTFWYDRRNGTDTRNGTVSDGRNFVSIDRKNVVSKWNWNGTAVDWRNATAGDRIRPVQPVVRAQNATVIDRRFGEVGYRWNVTTGDKYDRKNITRKMHQGRSKRHSMRRGPQHPHPQHHHGFVAVQGADASLPGTSEVRAARHGKLGMQTRVTTRDHNHVLVTETTNGETIVKTIAREGDNDELEDCDIIRGPLKMRKFYRKFLDDAPLGPAVVRATARRGHHGGPNGTHPHPHYRHHSNKMVVDRVTNRAWHSLNDSAHSWNDTLLDEYGQLTSFRKQMRRCKQWRKEHGRHHLTNQTTDATSPDITSQSEEEKADHLIEGKRVKRQLYAGTKWCGAGSSTQDEKDMGHHREVDKCCQKHDECPYNIEAFTTKWGLFNHRLTTISLCECDFRFRTCLRNVGTETADSVGYIFFEVVSPTCFNFRYEDVCVERTWYGKCTRTERQPRAVSRESLSFN